MTDLAVGEPFFYHTRDGEDVDGPFRAHLVTTAYGAAGEVLLETDWSMCSRVDEGMIMTQMIDSVAGKLGFEGESLVNVSDEDCMKELGIVRIELVEVIERRTEESRVVANIKAGL